MQYAQLLPVPKTFDHVLVTTRIQALTQRAGVFYSFGSLFFIVLRFLFVSLRMAFFLLWVVGFVECQKCVTCGVLAAFFVPHIGLVSAACFLSYPTAGAVFVGVGCAAMGGPIR